MVRNVLPIVALAGIAGITSAQVNFYTGSQIQNPDGIAVIDGNSPSGQFYQEAGLDFSITNSSFGTFGPHGDGTQGLYQSGGANSMTRIVQTSGDDFAAIEWDAADGWGQNYQYGWALALLDGQIVGDFAWEGSRGTVFGMDGDFDEVRVQAYNNVNDRNNARNANNQNAYGAISIDNITYVIPAPGAAAVLGLGGLVAARRRRA